MINKTPSQPKAADFSLRLVKIMPQVMRGFLRTQTDALAKGQITAPQYFVLDMIVSSGPMKMTDLARELSVSLPAISGLVGRMCRMKLVKRLYPEKDRRVIRVEVTAKGKNLVKLITSQRQKMFENIFASLSERDRSEYLRIILKIRNVLNRGKQG